MYSIVYFEKENTVEGVPTSWLQKLDSEQYCRWPENKSMDKISKMIKKCEPPSNEWCCIKCRVISAASTYKECKQKSKEASDQSATEPNSDGELLESAISACSDTSSDDEVPQPPQKIRKQEQSRSSKKEAQLNVTEMQTFFHEELKDSKTQIVKKLEKCFDKQVEAYGKLHKDILDLKEEIKLLKRVHKATVTPVTDPTTFPQLPLESMKNVEDFEAILNDDVQKQSLISMLANFSGASINSTVHQIMKKVLKNEVAVQFSMHGKGTKRQFIELKLCSCIREAALRSPAGKTAHASEVNKIIALNLTYAKDRIAGRKKYCERGENPRVACE